MNKVHFHLIQIVPIGNIDRTKSKGVKLEDFDFLKVRTNTTYRYRKRVIW